MSFSYDPTIPGDRDYVRLKTGDTDSTSVSLQDEELDALLADAGLVYSTSPARKYSASATALGMLLTRWAAAGKGVVSIQVSRLNIHQGVDQSAVQAIEAEIAGLKAMAVAAGAASGAGVLFEAM